MRRILLGLTVSLAASLAAIAAFRVPLAELALEALLRNNGFPDAELTVDLIALDRTELTNIRLATDMRLRKIILLYQPGDIIRLQAEQVRIEEPSIDIASGRNIGLARLRALAAGQGAGPGLITAWPPVKIENAMLRWSGAAGDLEIAGTGNVVIGGGRSLEMDFGLSASSEFGSWQADLFVTRRSDGAVLAHLENGRGDLKIGDYRVRDIVSTFHFELRDQELKQLRGRLRLARVERQNQPIGAMDLTIDGSPAELHGTISASILDSRLDAVFEGRAEIPGRLVHLSAIKAEVELDHGDRILRELELSELKSGRAKASIEASNIAISLATMPGSLGEFVDRILKSEVAADVAVSLEEITLADAFENLQSQIVGTIKLAPTALTFRPTKAIAASIERLSPSTLSATGLPPELTGQLEVPVAVALNGDARAPTLTIDWREALTAKVSGAAQLELAFADRLRLRSKVQAELTLHPILHAANVQLVELELSGRELSFQGTRFKTITADGMASQTAGGWAGQTRLNLHLSAPRFGDWRAVAARAALPVQFDVSQDRLRIWLTGAGKLDIRQPKFPLALDLPKTFLLTLLKRRQPIVDTTLSEEIVAKLHMAARLGGHGDIRLRTSDQALTIYAKSVATDLVAQVAKNRFETLDLRLRVKTGSLPDFHTDFGEATVDLALRNGLRTGRARFRMADILHTNDHLVAIPVRLTGDAMLDRQSIRFNAVFDALDEQLRIESTGRLHIPTRKLTAELMLPAVRLQPEKLQPADVVPWGKRLGAVSGQISGRATVNYAPNDVAAEATIDFRDIDVDAPEISFGGLTGRLVLSDLWPPKTASPQSFKIAMVRKPLTASDLTFAVSIPGEPGRPFGPIIVTGAGGDLEFAHVSIDKATIDPAADVYYAPLKLERLDLATLLEHSGIEGLTGIGSLRGTIPLRISNGALSIDKGELVADGPGVLRFTSEAAKQALASSGEQVALLLKALENFQFETLSITMDKPTAAQVSAKLKILGSNPDVLDGYPFAINIDLSGDFETLLSTILQAYRLSEETLRATVK